jgi:hypothetical protein
MGLTGAWGSARGRERESWWRESQPDVRDTEVEIGKHIRVEVSRAAAQDLIVFVSSRPGSSYRKETRNG